MEDDSTVSGPHSLQKSQVEEWLRAADKHIRAGRYLVADEELQKVLAADPDNEMAITYQDRIQFLIKQLSQRVGMNVELHAQIRKYYDRVAERRINELNSFLVKAQRALEDGYLKRASDFVKKALALDARNVYAMALQQRVSELEKSQGRNKAENEAQFKLRSVIQEMWRNGPPTEEQSAILAKMQQQLKISDGTRLSLEREARNALYKDSLQEIWNTGGISAFTPPAVDELRNKYHVSVIDHSAVEAALLREVRKNKIKGTILVVDEDEKNLLSLAHSLRAHSYAIAAAGSVEEAIATAKTIVPDVVLSEITFRSTPMGFELFQFIRTSQENRTVPFIFMAEQIDRMTSMISKRLGVDDLIAKPIDFEMLIATIGGMIVRSHGFQQNAKK